MHHFQGTSCSRCGADVILTMMDRAARFSPQLMSYSPTTLKGDRQRHRKQNTFNIRNTAITSQRRGPGQRLLRRTLTVTSDGFRRVASIVTFAPAVSVDFGRILSLSWHDALLLAVTPVGSLDGQGVIGSLKTGGFVQQRLFNFTLGIAAVDRR